MTTPPSYGFSKSTFASGATNRKKQKSENVVENRKGRWAITAMRTNRS